VKTIPVDRSLLAIVIHGEEHDVSLRRVKVRKDGRTHVDWSLVTLVPDA